MSQVQVASGDIVIIANTTYASNNEPFIATLNYQPFCPSDVPSCLASGKCNPEGSYNEYFYTVANMENNPLPFSYPQFFVFALEKGSNKGYNTLPNGTPIYAGTLVGFQSVISSGYMQTGPETGLGWDVVPW